MAKRTGPRPGFKTDGPKLRHLRVSRGITMTSLARQIGRDRSTICKAEASTILISEVLAYQIANALTEAGRKAGLDNPDVTVADILKDATRLDDDEEEQELAAAG